MIDLASDRHFASGSKGHATTAARWRGILGCVFGGVFGGLTLDLCAFCGQLRRDDGVHIGASTDYQIITTYNITKHNFCFDVRPISLTTS
jgi:hypothetical protein